MSRTGVVGGLWASTHPGPTLVVSVLTVALAVAAGVEPWRAALLVGSVFAGQVSVGLSNDAIDAARDRKVGRLDKPVARGVVDERLALAVAVVAVAVALALAAVIGPGLVAAHALALAGAWAYNTKLKATPWSLVPFVVSFGLLPSFATLTAAAPSLAPWWATTAGASLGAAVHLTNVLPDLEDDLRTAIRGLPHRLGARASSILSVAAVVGGAVAVLVGTGARGVLAWTFFAAVVLVAVATLARAIARPPDRAVFRLVMLAALLLAAQLVAAGGGLTG